MREKIEILIFSGIMLMLGLAIFRYIDNTPWSIQHIEGVRVVSVRAPVRTLETWGKCNVDIVSKGLYYVDVGGEVMVTDSSVDACKAGDIASASVRIGRFTHHLYEVLFIYGCK